MCLKEPSTDTTSSSLDGGDSTLESADASDTDNLTFPTTETTDLAAPTSSDTDSAGNDTLYPNDGSAPLPPAEICDGSDDIRFLYLADSTGFADRREVFYNTHGGHLLAIDGKCHFWASRGGGLLLEGDLAAPALASLQQTHYGRLGTYPKESAQCLDAPSKILWDPYGSTVCWCNCESEEEPGRTAAFSFAPTLLGELFATGTPTTGDLRLLLLTRSSTDEIEGQVAWPLTFEQSDIAQAPEEVEWFTDQGTLFPAGMDAQRLRLARAEFEDLTGGSTPVHFEYSAPDAGADGAVLSTGYLRDEPPSKVVAALETARAENPWPEL